jgi:hypothetical protein
MAEEHPGAGEEERIQGVRKSEAIHLDIVLSPYDYKRLRRCAEGRALATETFARMAILALIQQDEAAAELCGPSSE